MEFYDFTRESLNLEPLFAYADADGSKIKIKASQKENLKCASDQYEVEVNTRFERRIYLQIETVSEINKAAIKAKALKSFQKQASDERKAQRIQNPAN